MSSRNMALTVALLPFAEAFAPAARGSGIVSTTLPPHLSRPGQVSAVASPVELWEGYLGLLNTAPLTTKAISAGVIIGAADSTAQLVSAKVSGKEEDPFDVMRALRWAFFGLVLQGPWNHAFYLLLDATLPPTPDPFTITTLEKVGIDQFVQA